MLAGELRGGCSVARLVDGLWGDGLPADPGNALRILVSRARAQVGADVVVSTPTGYRLALAADAVDSAVVVRCAEECARAARSADHAAALAAALHDAEVTAEFDTRTDKHILRISRIQHGNVKSSVISADFIHDLTQRHELA